MLAQSCCTGRIAGLGGRLAEASCHSCVEDEASSRAIKSSRLPGLREVIAARLASAFCRGLRSGGPEMNFFQCLETLLAELRSAATRPGSVVIIPGAPAPAWLWLSALSSFCACLSFRLPLYSLERGGWLRRRATAGYSDLGHAVLLVLFRSFEAEEFILGVVNTGEGLQYHPASLSRAQPNPEMPLRQSPLVLTSIPTERVCSSALWYLLYRQILHPDPENGTVLSQKARTCRLSEPCLSLAA